jgi:hypothetical protein
MTPADVLSFVHTEARPAGLNVLRIAEDGSKRPDPPVWKQWQTQGQSERLIEAWFGAGTGTGVGIVCGYADVESLDFDDAGTWELFRDTADAAGLELVQRIIDGWCDQTPGGGVHLIYRCEAVEGNQALARRPDPDHPRRAKATIETRGRGGLVVVAPSHGAVHPSGRPYRRLSGGPLTMATITPAERAELFAFARAFDEMPAKEIDPPKPRGSAAGGTRPGDALNAQADRDWWRRRLAGDGWAYVYTSGEIDYYRRPGKASGISGSVNWDGRCRFRVHTTSTPLEPAMYSPFAYVATVDHDGDWKAASRALAGEGYGERRGPPTSFGRQRHAVGDGDEEADQEGPQVLAPGLAHFRNAFYAIRETEDGIKTTPLSNFAFRIVKHITKDSGAETTSFFELECVHQSGDVRRVTVSTAEFGGLSWVTRELPPTWIVYAGMSTAQKVRQAAQHLTEREGFETQTLYQFTGWTDVDGEHVYLHADGGIGADGPRIDVETDLPGKLGLVRLPAPLRSEALRPDALTSLRLLELGPAHIMAPLFGTIPAAILSPFHLVDFAPQLWGRTGTFKTETAALVQRHWGADFNKLNLVASWTGTANALERLAFLAKDMVAVFDDFQPEGTSSDQARMHATMQRLLRSAGNAAGRQRMNVDGSLRPEFYPRGLVLSTGEDLARGHSTSGRSLAIEVAPGDINPAILTELQRAGDDGAFARVTASVIRWVAANWELVGRAYRAGIAEHVATLRARPMAHTRNPETLGTLLAAAAVWLEALVKLQAITRSECDAALRRCVLGIHQVGELQADVISTADPVNQFLQLVGAALQSGDAHLASTDDNGEPSNCTIFGWRMIMQRTSEGVMPDPRPQGTRIGWVDQRSVFLIPEAALSVVQTLGSRQGVTIPWSAKTLGKRLVEAGKVVSHEAGRSLQKVRVDGSMQRALHLATDDVVMFADVFGDHQKVIDLTHMGVAS